MLNLAFVFYQDQKASKEAIDQKDKQRVEVGKRVEENIKDNQVPNQDSFGSIIEKNYDASIWKEEASTCVECGACNVICPTCHCFLLYDQKDEENMARLRIWDSCMVKDFARVAGGANPRERLWMIQPLLARKPVGISLGEPK